MVDKNDDDNPEVDDVDGDNEDECEKVGKKQKLPASDLAKGRLYSCCDTTSYRHRLLFKE